jgi:Uncharacterised nucleotidyltransferase
MEMSPEFQLFCLALRTPHDAPGQEAMHEAAASSIDWDAILAGARRHRVAPHLIAGLRGGASVSVPVLDHIKRQAAAAVQRSLGQIVEIGLLHEAFAAAGIRALFLKGVVLSAQLFGDGAKRDARDIDVLSEPKKFGAAAELIERLGYRRYEYARSPRQRRHYARQIKDVEFRHARTGMRLELHHRLTDNPSLLPSDFDALWRERDEVRLGDSVIPTLPRAALPLYLCAHGAGHGWERLQWLVDFAGAVRPNGGIEDALAAAERAGLTAPMLHALLLAHDWLALPVAGRHLARARESATVRRLDRILAHLYSGAAWHAMPARNTAAGYARYSLWQRLYRLSFKPDWRYRFEQIRREWFTAADWDTLHLPDSLFFLYPLARPFAWIGRRRRRR